MKSFVQTAIFSSCRSERSTAMVSLSRASTWFDTGIQIMVSRHRPRGLLATQQSNSCALEILATFVG